MDSWPAPAGAPHVSTLRGLHPNDAVGQHHGYPGESTPDKRNTIGGILRGGPNRERKGVSAEKVDWLGAGKGHSATSQRRRRPRPNPGRARPTSNASRNNDISATGMEYHPLQSRRTLETNGAGPADTGASYYANGSHSAVGRADVALIPPSYPSEASRPEHNQPNEILSPSTPPFFPGKPTTQPAPRHSCGGAGRSTRCLYAASFPPRHATNAYRCAARKRSSAG